jgi:hypothetical protein
MGEEDDETTRRRWRKVKGGGWRLLVGVCVRWCVGWDAGRGGCCCLLLLD